MSTLLAGPWVGEFGWEVMTWCPAVRRYSRKFDSTIIACHYDHRYLYEDFTNRFVYYDKSGSPDRWFLNGKETGMPKIIKGLFSKVHVVLPRRNNCMSWKRDYFRYGKKDDRKAYDLVIHARACTKYGQRSWNWPKPRYRKLLEALKLEKVCSIGTEAHHIEGTEDKRKIELEDLCNILASSRVLLSPSSGPGHLASLCGCPQVIMTSDKWQKQIKGTNKDRYKHIWNPFDTPCKVLDKDNWQPPVDKVVKAVERFL